MHLTHHASGRALLAHAGAVLEEHEAENSLLLGICTALGDNATAASGAPAYLVTIHDHERVVGAAVRTPPHNVVVSRAPREALALVRDDLRASETSLPAVIGPRDAVHAFADLWVEGMALAATIQMRQGIYELAAVTPPRDVPGALRRATPDDEPLACAWARAFAREVGLSDDEIAFSDPSTRRALVAGRLYIWASPDPVSLAGIAARTAHGARINSVYTPPEHRAHGYASACVAALSQLLLDEGARFCCLYTDLANPTSNSVYTRIGYVNVGEAAVIRFTPRSL